jgi:hypothetical protein
VKYFLSRRVQKDQRCDASLGASGGQPGSNAMGGGSLDVHQRSWGQPYPSRGAELDINNEKDSQDERSGTVLRR